MKCIKCGFDNTPGAKFCNNCGNMLNSNTNTFETVKSFGKSPMFLIAIIAYSATLLLNILFFVEFTFKIPDEFINSFVSNASQKEMVDEIVRVANSVLPIVVSAISIPSILICVGLWLIYASARDKNSPYVKTTGLNMIRVIIKITFVFTMIGLSISAVSLTVLAVLVSKQSDDPKFFIAVIVLVVLFIFLLALIVFFIIYYIKTLSTIKTIKDTAETGIPSDKISMFVAIVTLISGGSNLMSLPASLFNFSTLPLGIIAVLQGLSISISYALFGVLLITYRNKMKELTQPTYNPNTVYQNPQQFTQQ